MHTATFSFTDEYNKLNPAQKQVFDLTDIDGNFFRVEPTKECYREMGHPSDGVAGCSIGVTNMEAAMNLYSNLLGYDEVVFDRTGTFNDWGHLPGGKEQYRRLRLKQSAPTGGAFAPVLGETFIELVHALDRVPARTFKGRIWGDSGFVHLGLDVKGMKKLGANLAEQGFGFRCDSNDALSMGQTKVHCTYIDDPDLAPYVTRYTQHFGDLMTAPFRRNIMDFTVGIRYRL